MNFTTKPSMKTADVNLLGKNKSVSPHRPTVSRKSLIRNNQKVVQIIDRTDSQQARRPESAKRRRGNSDLLTTNLQGNQPLKGRSGFVSESAVVDHDHSEPDTAKPAKQLQLPFNLKTLPATSNEVELNFMKDYFQKKEASLPKSSQESPFTKGAIKVAKKYSFEQKGQKNSDKDSTSSSNCTASKQLTGSFLERGQSDTASPENKKSIFRDSTFRMDKSSLQPSSSMTEEQPKAGQPLPFIKSRITQSKGTVGSSAKDISKSALLADDGQSHIKIVHRKSNYSKPLADVFKSEPIPTHLGLSAGLAGSPKSSGSQNHAVHQHKKYYFPTIHKYLSHLHANKSLPESSLLSHLREVHDVVQNLPDFLTSSPSLLLSREVVLLGDQLEACKSYLVLDIDETLVHSSKQRPVRIGDQSTQRYKTVSVLIGSEETKVVKV